MTIRYNLNLGPDGKAQAHKVKTDQGAFEQSASNRVTRAGGVTNGGSAAMPRHAPTTKGHFEKGTFNAQRYQKVGERMNLYGTNLSTRRGERSSRTK